MTTLVSPLDLKDWFGENVRSLLCINPVSISPQPVHALGTFFARSTEISGQRRLADLARLVATKHGLWTVSNEHIRDEVRYQLPTPDHELEQLRHALAGLLAADRAVYKGTYSFQLAHVTLAANDRTDNGLGELGSRLVLSSPDGIAAMEAVVDRLFERQPNPHWAIASLLIESKRSDVKVGPLMAPPPWTEIDQCQDLAEECRSLLIRTLRLVAEGHDTLLSLRVLATTLTWIGQIVYAQVPSLVMESRMKVLLAEAGDPGQLPGLRDASAASRRGLNGAWEGWLAHQLSETIADRFSGIEPSTEVMIEFLQGCKPYSIAGGAQAQTTNARIPDVYATWLENHPPFIAGGNTLQDVLAASMGNKPVKWFDAVGRHCGFIGPRRGHPSRFRAEVSLLPTLVMAGTLPSDSTAVPMSEWLERMITKFGVVFGPHSEARNMPDRAPEEDLERNRDLLSQLLAAVGLARRYSDGVTEVLNLNMLWRPSQ